MDSFCLNKNKKGIIIKGSNGALKATNYSKTVHIVYALAYKIERDY